MSGVAKFLEFTVRTFPIAVLLAIILSPVAKAGNNNFRNNSVGGVKIDAEGVLTLRR